MARMAEWRSLAVDGGKAQRFRAAALPCLDDVYTLARYLLSNPADAEDAAQECYLRAFRHFDTFRGGPIKPWLLAILRNVCRAEYARRGALAAVSGRAGCGGRMRKWALECRRGLAGIDSVAPFRRRDRTAADFGNCRNRFARRLFCARSMT